MSPTLAASDLERRKEAVVRQHGAWTDHNIHLGDDVYTMPSRRVSPKWRRVVQMVADVAGQPLDSLRILDLACLEGQYAIEFARHGARVVGIEGREGNIAKARFAKEALGLENVEFHQDDVRNLSAAKYGQFDVVLCLGLLYHLDAPDVFEFLKRIGDVCRRFAVIDTYVSLADKESYAFDGHTYWGRRYFEHTEDSSRDERLRNVWASLDNSTSVWLTRPSLLNVLTHVGFTSTYECHTPVETNKLRDRLTLVAVKGRRQQLLNIGDRPAPQAEEWPETPFLDTHVVNRRFGDVTGRLSRVLPRSLRQSAKRLVQRVGLGGR
jgi:SAM-dependent methyltransferase